jgi:hypothetical protein
VVTFSKLGEVYSPSGNGSRREEKIMPLDMLLQEAKGMTDDELMEVVHFMQFLKIAPAKSVAVFVSPMASQEKKIYREPGLYKDQIKITEGFDDPLDDFEEYM